MSFLGVTRLPPGRVATGFGIRGCPCYPSTRTKAGCPSGQWEWTVNPSRKLRRFESFTCHPVHKRAPDQRKRRFGAFFVAPARVRLISGSERCSTGVSGELVGKFGPWPLSLGPWLHWFSGGLEGRLDPSSRRLVLSGDARGVNAEKHVDAVARPLRDLSCGHAGVQPEGDCCVAQVVGALGEGRVVLIVTERRPAGSVPDPVHDAHRLGTREWRCDGHSGPARAGDEEATRRSRRELLEVSTQDLNELGHGWNEPGRAPGPVLELPVLRGPPAIGPLSPRRLRRADEVERAPASWAAIEIQVLQREMPDLRGPERGVVDACEECFQRRIDAPHFCEQGACLVRIDDDAAVDDVGVGWRLPLHLVHGIPRQSTDLNAELESAVERRTLSCDCAGRRRGAIQPECKSIQHGPQSRRFGELLEGGRSAPSPGDHLGEGLRRGSGGGVLPSCSGVEGPTEQGLSQKCPVRSTGRQRGTGGCDEAVRQPTPVLGRSVCPLRVYEGARVFKPIGAGGRLGCADRKARVPVEGFRVAQADQQGGPERLCRLHRAEGLLERPSVDVPADRVSRLEFALVGANAPNLNLEGLRRVHRSGRLL